MKCTKCNSEIEQDALFCPYCGNEIEHTKLCSKCGKPLDDDSDFCPYCGTKQSGTTEPNIIEETKEGNIQNTITSTSGTSRGGSKKWLWIVSTIMLIGLLCCGGYFLFINSSKSHPSLLVQETDSIAEMGDSVMTTDEEAEMMNAMAARNQAMEQAMIDERIEFIKLMYEDFFENHNFNIESAANLKKYLAPNVMERILIECPYDGCEGEKSYIVDCFRDGSLSYERPDYGDKVVKREINSIDSEWFEVTNYWDVIKEPVKIKIKIGSDDNGNYKVIDFR